MSRHIFEIAGRANETSQCKIELFHLQEVSLWALESFMARIFVSYSRKNIDFCKQLTAELQKRDLDFWVDWAIWLGMVAGFPSGDCWEYIANPLHPPLLQVC